ncbi:MAG: hypothetical protein M1818_004118 [Claussenomyces sp. TS43310]|nr:MAG: hypothetical protein M1818_004118 [Claussenomyces sp. TS43310]
MPSTGLPTLTAILFFLLSTSLMMPVAAQVAAGGGVQGATIATQMATTTTAPSLIIAGTGTDVQYVPYTQTFKTPLGSWAFVTPSPGTIGLGTIAGAVGTIKSG